MILLTGSPELCFDYYYYYYCYVIRIRVGKTVEPTPNFSWLHVYIMVAILLCVQYKIGLSVLQ